jgi:dipeptidyl-peptidase-4
VLGPALEDQVAALTEAARSHLELDLGRVGIRGWSFGGSLAALAVLRGPDVFHAAVAGAAPTDLRLYDTHWRERFYGHPDPVPRAVRGEVTAARGAKLDPPLLLIHGLADDNVFPANMVAPVQRSAGRRAAARGTAADQCHAPSQRRNRRREPAVAQAGFFRRHLGHSPSPRLPEQGSSWFRCLGPRSLPGRRSAGDTPPATADSSSMADERGRDRAQSASH